MGRQRSTQEERHLLCGSACRCCSRSKKQARPALVVHLGLVPSVSAVAPACLVRPADQALSADMPEAWRNHQVRSRGWLSNFFLSSMILSLFFLFKEGKSCRTNSVGAVRVRREVPTLPWNR